MNASVPKKTGTYADTLQAIGLADLLNELCGEVPDIVDQGPAFRICTSKDATENWRAPLPGYPYIWDSKQESKPPAGNFLDYRAEIQKRDAVRAALKTNAKARREIREELQEQGMDSLEPPRPELGVATILASMRRGWDGDRQLYRWLSEDRSRALRWAKHKLGLDDSELPDPNWSNTQFLNPITGKGVHSPKTVA